MKFSELGLSEGIVNTLTEIGYEQPTPIQEQTIKLALEGRDVLGQAQTGTGKQQHLVFQQLKKLMLLIQLFKHSLLLQPANLRFKDKKNFSVLVNQKGLKFVLFLVVQVLKNKLKALKLVHILLWEHQDVWLT